MTLELTDYETIVLFEFIADRSTKNDGTNFPNQACCGAKCPIDARSCIRPSVEPAAPDQLRGATRRGAQTPRSSSWIFMTTRWVDEG